MSRFARLLPVTALLLLGSSQRVLAAECDAVLKQGAMSFGACTRRGCDAFAIGGSHESHRRHSACLDACAKAMGSEYQRCYAELMAKASAAGLAPTDSEFPGVSADCFAGDLSITCHKGRIEDAKMLVRIFEPAIGRAGWRLGCFDVEYVKGDAGAPDAILVVLHGQKGGQAPGCRNLPYEPDPRKAAARAAGAAVLKPLGGALAKAIRSATPVIRGRVLRSVRALEVGDGWGGAATVLLAGTHGP